jgi:hypothetical protein
MCLRAIDIDPEQSHLAPSQMKHTFRSMKPDTGETVDSFTTHLKE